VFCRHGTDEVPRGAAAPLNAGGPKEEWSSRDRIQRVVSRLFDTRQVRRKPPPGRRIRETAGCVPRSVISACVDGASSSRRAPVEERVRYRAMTTTMPATSSHATSRSCRAFCRCHAAHSYRMTCRKRTSQELRLSREPGHSVGSAEAPGCVLPLRASGEPGIPPGKAVTPGLAIRPPEAAPSPEHPPTLAEVLSASGSGIGDRGSGIRDRGPGIGDPGSGPGIRISLALADLKARRHGSPCVTARRQTRRPRPTSLWSSRYACRSLR
jgi:hypothetical protein